MDNSRKSSFISYRWREGEIIAKEIFKWLNNMGIDCFLDKESLHNDSPLSEAIVKEVKSKKSFIFLFSNNTLSELLEYAETRNANSEKDYVYLELTTALQSHCSIIPVCIDNSDERIIKTMIDKLFEYFACSDTYYFIKKPSSVEISALCEEIVSKISEPEIIHRTDLTNIYWIGTRQSDIPKDISFKGSISLFGDKEDENNLVMCSSNNTIRVDHNDSTDISQDEFVIKSIGEILQNDQHAEFMLYNPSTVYRLNLEKLYGKRFVCLNTKEVLDCVNNKSSIRVLLKDVVEQMPVLECSRYDCSYNELVKKYKSGYFNCDLTSNEDPEFIIQAPISSGGDGTFLLNKENEKSVLSSLDKNAKYIVSIYHRNNISVNKHVIVYDESIIYLPGSIQLIKHVSSENKLLYKGADFIAYKDIDHHLISEFEDQVCKVATKLQEKGYRGILGIDAIIYDKKVSILEVNGRFQASSELINKALSFRGFKTLQELNMDAFNGNIPTQTECNLKDISVMFSNYSYTYEGTTHHEQHMFNLAKDVRSSKRIVELQGDGFTGVYDGKRGEAYLFRVVFNSNISSINEDGNVLINENISSPEKWLTDKILKKERLAIKIALLIQGIVIEKEETINIREATNNAVDLKIGQMIINAPTDIKYVEFSPFYLKKTKQNDYSIYYYDNLLIDNISIFLADIHQDEIVNNHKCSEIAYLSTDRLRLHLTNTCYFKCEGKNKHNEFGNSCKFCNIKPLNSENEIKIEDVEKAVNLYINDRNRLYKEYRNAKTDEKPIMLRHFLIGGQSLKHGDEKLIEIAHLLSKYKLPIYAMTLPLKTETVKKMIAQGVYEFSYNIEIFDEQCREKYMPGKSKIPLKEYYEALFNTEKVLNQYAPRYAKKVVRSMVIVGLEPYYSMLEGIKTLIDHNIEPMLSVFRPLPNTELENLNAPPIKMVYDLFNSVSQILYDKTNKNEEEYKKLGPQCVCCQNNTISLPWSIQTSFIPNKHIRIISDPNF